MTAVDTGARPGRLAAAWATMHASTSLRHRAWMLFMGALLLVAAAALILFVRDTDKVMSALLVIVAILNVMLWSGWFSRLALLRTQAAGFCLPGVAAATTRTLWIGACCTVLLPALALSVAGADPRLAIGIPALGALAGLLFSLLPWPLAFALVMLPSVGTSVLAPLIERIDAAIGTTLVSTDMVLPWTALIAVLVAWRWRMVVRTLDPESVPRWRRALVMTKPQNAMDFGATPTDADANAWQARAGWMSPATRVDDAGPHAPAAAIGACLGGPMGRVAGRELVKQWGIVAILIAIAFAVPFRGDAVMIRDALLFGGLVGLLGSGWALALRLYRQRQRHSGEFAELALLPGLGSPDAARESLLRRVLQRVGHLLVFALTAQVLLAWLRDMTGVHLGLMAMLWLGVCAGSVLICLRALAGRQLDSFRTFLIMLPLIGLVATTLVVAFLRIESSGLASGLFVAWSAAIVVYLLASMPSLRTFRARPHAFLLP